MALGPPRPWGRVVATPGSPKKPEQLPGLTKPVSCEDGAEMRKANDKRFILPPVVESLASLFPLKVAAP